MPDVTLSLSTHGAHESFWPDLDEKARQGQLLAPPLEGAVEMAAACIVERDGSRRVLLRIDYPDGRTAVALTSVKLLATAAAAFTRD